MIACHRKPQAGELLNAHCPECKHVLVIHDHELGCIICDYKANIRDRVAHAVGPLRLIDERDVMPDGRDLP